MKRASLVSVLVLLAGCDATNSPEKLPVTTASATATQAMSGRFAVFQGNSRLALDTKTGLACKTWNWTNPSFKGSIPLCADLYTDEDYTVKQAKIAPASDATMNAIVDGLKNLGKAKTP